MASAAPLRDIDEQFLQCAICLNQLRDPKILPCLHRYCRECIKGIAPKKGKKLECPTCREKHSLPEGGTDSLKTDFNTKNIIEFIQLQDSVKHEPLKVCANCSKKLKVASFCFRCNDFLCQSCDEHHKTSKIVRDHRPHIFSISEVEARNFTIAKLSSLKEGPRCHHHQERAADLCCTTCGNLPICMPCTHGDHQGHNLKEVGSLARIERGKLTERVADLMQYKDKVYQTQEKIRKAAKELRRQVDEKKKQLQKETDTSKERAKAVIRGKEGQLEQHRIGLGQKLERKLEMRKQELDEDIKRATKKYDKSCEEDRREVDAELKDLQREIEREKKQSQERLEVTNKEIKDLLQSVMNEEEEVKSKKTKEMTDHFDDIVKRFEIATTTASSILDAKCDWTDVQCIPDVCSAIDPLIVEIRGEFPVLEMFTEIKVESVSSAATGGGVKVGITERAESVVDVKRFEGWRIEDITSNKDATCVLTGCMRIGGYRSHITVINWKGGKLRQDRYESNRSWPNRFCDFLSRFHIATVCERNEIGVYDIRNGSYRKANICDITSSWPADRFVSCVAVDPANNRILVGGVDSSDVAVFSSDLEHIHTMTLPGEILWPRDMTIHSSSNSLLVCDYEGEKAYAVTMEKGSACKIKYEFMKSNVDGGDLRPTSVCIDKNGFVYMLWGSYRNTICVQYSQVGRQLLTTRPLGVGTDARCITTVETEQGEKLVIPTSGSYRECQLIIYGLIVNH